MQNLFYSSTRKIKSYGYTENLVGITLLNLRSSKGVPDWTNFSPQNIDSFIIFRAGDLLDKTVVLGVVDYYDSLNISLAIFRIWRYLNSTNPLLNTFLICQRRPKNSTDPYINIRK